MKLPKLRKKKARYDDTDIYVPGWFLYGLRGIKGWLIASIVVQALGLLARWL